MHRSLVYMVRLADLEIWRRHSFFFQVYHIEEYMDTDFFPQYTRSLSFPDGLGPVPTT